MNRPRTISLAKNPTIDSQNAKIKDSVVRRLSHRRVGNAEKVQECDEVLNFREEFSSMEQHRRGGTDFLSNRRGSLQAGLRSVSEGGKKVERARNTTREGSVGSVVSLDVRCACQYFQCDSLLPEKSLQSKSSRPNSRISQNASLRTNQDSDKFKRFKSDLIFKGNHVTFNLDDTEVVMNNKR